MSEIYICPKCKSEYKKEEAQKNMKMCKECGGILIEKKENIKEYIIEFDNFKIEFTLPIKLGRNYQKEFKDNKYISREHCELIKENEIIFVIDKSTNGTFINGNKVITKTSINPGDKLKLANIEAIFKEK